MGLWEDTCQMEKFICCPTSAPSKRIAAQTARPLRLFESVQHGWIEKMAKRPPGWPWPRPGASLWGPSGLSRGSCTYPLCCVCSACVLAFEKIYVYHIYISVSPISGAMYPTSLLFVAFLYVSCRSHESFVKGLLSADVGRASKCPELRKSP